FTAYLHRRTAMEQVAFHPGARMPPGYGSAAFFADLDRDAPPRPGPHFDRSPYLASVYPFGYYALLASWIELLRCCSDRLTVLLFGARALSALLLAGSLAASYAAARELGFGPWRCVLLTGVLGFFPLTSFVSGYVQPDNLSFTLVSLSFYLALRARRRG